ncbi:hypothetical protein JNB63_17490 [Microbacterium trichothecenolyticum]|uniref:hypothetical protein n=1 Tax=Microbacterium trichothecenolyticum TaxID=69370 RepID=UPI001C6ED785|nr:hypothetical protein [Microbacterium trichothecenolyticum]MBW9121894.1 hypothetical protein [Microbacterium trichothecenolyticum]
MIDTTPSTTTASRNWLGVLLLVVACAGVLMIIGTINRDPSPVQRPADGEAESFADENLLEQLSTAAAGTDAEDGEPVARVEALLQSLTGERVTGSYATILVGPRSGDSFPVAVYSYWEDESFSGSPDDAYYGRACRIFTVDDRAVASETVDCPASVPEIPVGVSLTSESWPLG